MTDNKKNKVAIISLYSIKNLGARYVHAYLKAQGYYAKLFFMKDLNIDSYQPETDEEINVLISKIKADGYNVVGLSIGSSAFADLAKKLTHALKQETSALVIWGGVHPTILPEKCINFTDIICIGEGEKPLFDLLERLEKGQDYTHINNLWVKREGVVYKNEIRNLSENIDELPWPKYLDNDTYFINKNKIEQFDPIKQQEWEYVIMTSRGCPYRCSYCINSFYWKMYKDKGKYLRQRSVENVINELSYAKDKFKNIKKIAFYDDVFGLNVSWNRDFVAEYKEKIGLPFWCYVHPQAIKKENLELLKDAGLYMVDIGLQSGSEQIRKGILKRSGTNKNFREALQVVHDVGLMPIVDVIADNPYETEEDKRETFELLLGIRPFNIVMLSLTHFPMTELTHKALTEGVIKREDVDDIKKNVFYMWRAKPFSNKDSNENVFWKSLIFLSTKYFIPVWVLKYVSRQDWVKRTPHILIPLVYISNYIKWFGVGIKLLAKGQVSLSMIRQWAKYVFTVGS